MANKIPSIYSLNLILSSKTFLDYAENISIYILASSFSFSKRKKYIIKIIIYSNVLLLLRNIIRKESSLIK